MGTKVNALGRFALAFAFLSGATIACNVEGATNTRFGAVTGDVRRNESGLHLNVQFKTATAKGVSPRAYGAYVGVNTEKGYPKPYGFFSAADENGL